MLIFKGLNIVSEAFNRSVTGKMTGYIWMFDPGFALTPLALRFLPLQVDAKHGSD